MSVLAVILARAGSRSVPEKCIQPILGRPMITYTFDHALAAESVDAVVLTTDSVRAKKLAREHCVEVVDRPAEMATDTAPVYPAIRHAVESWEATNNTAVSTIVILYGNIPVRRAGVIDNAIAKLRDTGADSVRTVAPIGKHHPDWLHRLANDRMEQFRPNDIYRRQQLEPLYYHDGAVLVVTRQALFTTKLRPDGAEDPFAFLGEDRAALIQRPEDSVDVDEPLDLHIAEAILRSQGVTPCESVKTSSAPAAALV